MSEIGATEEQTVSTSKGKVLVIDDEADIRESLDALLSLEGYDVELAAKIIGAVLVVIAGAVWRYTQKAAASEL